MMQLKLSVQSVVVCFVSLFHIGNWSLGFSGRSSLDQHMSLYWCYLVITSYLLRSGVFTVYYNNESNIVIVVFNQPSGIS